MIRSSLPHAPQHRSIEHGVSLGLVPKVTNEGEQISAELRLYLKGKKETRQVYHYSLQALLLQPNSCSGMRQGSNFFSQTSPILPVLLMKQCTLSFMDLKHHHFLYIKFKYVSTCSCVPHCSRNMIISPHHHILLIKWVYRIFQYLVREIYHHCGLNIFVFII